MNAQHHHTSGNGSSLAETLGTGRRSISGRNKRRSLSAALDPLFVKERAAITGKRRALFEHLENRRMLSVAGSLDQTFGTGGLLTTNLASNGNDEAYSIALQSGGYVVAGGANGQGAFGLARYSGSGSLLSNVEAAISAPGQAQAVTVLPDGKILAAGYSF